MQTRSIQALSASTLFALVFAGCATTKGPTATVEYEPVKVVAEPAADDGLEFYDAASLYERGVELLEGDANEEAAHYFDRVIAEFPDSSYVISAYYRLSIAALNLEDGERALAAADAYLAALPEGAPNGARLNGLFKRGAALALLERYEEAAELFDLLLVEPLSARDEIEALVDAGVAHFMRGDRFTAEYRFLKARRLYQKASKVERLAVKYFVAQAAFYLAELARMDYDEYKLHYPTDEEASANGHQDLETFLGEQLEQKCQLLLRAQYMFLRVIRDEHVGWASAAGYKVGTMYEALYEELMDLPNPEDLDANQQSMFRRLMRDKVLVLLEKAIRVWQSTAEMATRTGADNEWVSKTRASLDRVRGFVVAESKRLAKTDGAPEQS